MGLATHVELPKLNLDDKCLAWVKELKYFGVTFVSGTDLIINMNLNYRKFLGALLAILQKCKFLSEGISCN